MVKPFAVVIAAGGASTRLGEFKPLANLNGRPLISYAMDCASRASSRVYLLLNNRSQYDCIREAVRHLRAVVIYDRKASSFPCSLMQSMAQVQEEVLFLMGCDTPFLDSRLPQLLLSRLGSSSAVAPLWPNGYIEPMTALYLKSDLPLSRVFSSMKSMVLAMNTSLVKIADLGLNPDSFMNINSPSDLQVAGARFSSVTNCRPLFDELQLRRSVPVSPNLRPPLLA